MTDYHATALPGSASPDQLVWQDLFWPQPLDESAATGLVRHWGAQRHAPLIVLETRADDSGISYLIGSQARHRSTVARDIEQHVIGAIVTSHPEERPPTATARRLRLSSPGALTDGHDESATRALMVALSRVRRHEHLVLQVVLGARFVPSLSATQAEVGQSIGSRLSVGVRDEKRRPVVSAIEAKAGQHGFQAVVRVGVEAATEERRKVLLRGVMSAIAMRDGAVTQVAFAHEKSSRLDRPSLQWSPWPRPRLSTDEVVALSGWPSSDARTEPYPGQAPAHPKVLRPTAAAREDDRIIGTAVAPGGGGVVGIGDRDSRQHLWTIGPTGTGKSTLLRTLIAQDLAAGRPIVVVEPKDLVAEVLEDIPKERRDDIVILDPTSDHPVGLNPLQRFGRSPQVVADSLFAVFASLYGEGLGPRSSDILRNSLTALSHHDDASLVMLPLLLTNPGFRRSITQRVIQADPIVAGPFWHSFDQLSPDAVAQMCAPLLNKIRPLLSPSLRAVLGQRAPRFNLRDVIRGNKVLLVPLQKGVIGAESAQLLGALVVAELWQALQEQAAVPPKQRPTIMVYLDEVQEYLRLPTDLGDALAMSRSLGGAFHVAHQFLDQLPRAMRAAFQANARSRIVFQLGPDDARAVAAGQSLLTAEDFQALPAHQVYAALMRDTALQPWVSVATAPPPNAISRPADIRRRSREQYGQPLSEIEAGFLELITDTHGVDGANDRIGGPRRRRGSS